jgi:hypothetical protein
MKRKRRTRPWGGPWLDEWNRDLHRTETTIQRARTAIVNQARQLLMTNSVPPGMPMQFARLDNATARLKKLEQEST